MGFINNQDLGQMRQTLDQAHVDIIALDLKLDKLIELVGSSMTDERHERYRLRTIVEDLVLQLRPQTAGRWRNLVIDTAAPRETPHWYILTTEGQRNWKATLNLAMLQRGTDKLLVRLEVAVPDYSGPQSEIINNRNIDYTPAVDWQQTELYDVWMAAVRPDDVTGGGVYMHVNGQPVNPSGLLMLEAPAGPWDARLSVAQYGGINGVLPFLIY